eukprot:Hpha_TRINITY_DN6133_c0_g1::TRINITY_DN6133_c0_g1_i1::g.164902::m.164902
MSEIRSVQTVHLKSAECTPSLLYNNLSGIGDTVAYVHKNEIVIADLSDPDAPQARQPLSHGQWKAKTAIYQVRLLQLGGGVNVMATATTTAIQFWDIDKGVLICTATSIDDREVFLSRGVDAFPHASQPGGMVFVGHSNGTVSVVEYQGMEASLMKTLGQHADNISDVRCGTADGCGNLIASADIGGELILWDADTLQERCRTTFPGDTLTSVHISGSFIIGGFGSGLIRLYEAKNCAVYAEVAAHARWINALAMHPSGEYVASVAEDMLFCLWRLPSKDNGGKVQLAAYKLLKDCILTGVEFIAKGKKAVVAAYDMEFLQLLQLPI